MAHLNLVGREDEQQRINSLLAAIRETGSALLVSGEAGIGKSSLLEYARLEAQRQDLRYLKTTGYESELYAPFAGLHELLRPIYHLIGSLPANQADALRGAFDASETVVVNLYLVGLATLNLLSSLATTQSLLIVVEDAQWLDQSSGDVLTFVARRLEHDAIVLLFALRRGVECSLAYTDLPELILENLQPAKAAALLDRAAPELPPDIRRHILDTAVGNPLALIELPLTFSENIDRGALLIGWLPLTERLERAFAARVQTLSFSARTFLLVAALDPDGSLPELLQVASMLSKSSVSIDTIDEAASAGLLKLEQERVRFNHPLMRSAIYQAASLKERKAAHASLADVLDAPERRVWHRALSIIGVDEGVAVELEKVADRANQRGLPNLAIVSLNYAASLSEDRMLRGKRLLQAAEIAFDLGRPNEVIRLLQQVEVAELELRDKLTHSWILEVVAGTIWSGAAWLNSFAIVSEQLHLLGEDAEALDLLQFVSLRAFWSNPSLQTQMLVVSSVEKLFLTVGTPKYMYVLSLVAPIQRGALVVSYLRHVDPAVRTDLEQLHYLATAATAVGVFDLAELWLDSVIRALRVQGRLGSLAQLLTEQAWCGIHLGKWSLVRQTADEGARLAQDTNQTLWFITARLADAISSSYQGNTKSVGKIIEDAEQFLLPNAINPVLAIVQFARGARALAEGLHAEAFEALSRIYQPSDICYHPIVRFWVYADLVEAAVYSGNQARARELFLELEKLEGVNHSPVLSAALTFARPLLADDEIAETLFRQALKLDLQTWPFYRARLLFGFGSWLRRHRRVAESREFLQMAQEAFVALGAIPWMERALAELRAAGVASYTKSSNLIHELSPQEHQIAQMAATGMSNRDIAAQLFLSHRTVSTHLYRIFPKLGVTSRYQLAEIIKAQTSFR